MIPTNQLRQFYHVAKMGSIRKAARYLNKSQSAVSTAIKNLEDELGCQLLVRSSNSTNLTEKGQKLHNFAAGFLEASESLRTELSLDTPAKKILHFGANKHYEELCGPLLSQFMFKHPDVELKVHFTDGEFLRNEFQTGQLDVILGINFTLAGIATEDLPNDALFVLSDSVRLACSKDHPLAKRTTLSMDDLKEYSFILPSFYEDPIRQLFRKNKIELRTRAIMNSGKMSAYLLKNTTCFALLAPGTLPDSYRSHLAFPVFDSFDLTFNVIIRFREQEGLEAIAIERFRSVAHDWINESF